MALYRLEIKIIGRSAGHSVVAAAAYRSGERLPDERLGLTQNYASKEPASEISLAAAAAYRSGTEIADEQTGKVFDYTRKRGIMHCEILAPDGAPSWVFDRAELWNRVERREDRSTRADTAQLAREVLLTLPRELNLDQQRALVHTYLREEYVSKGMITDFAIHHETASDGQPQPHCHVLLTMRRLSSDGQSFGNKARDWNPTFTNGQWVREKDKIIGIRTSWERYVNAALDEAGSNARVDARSYAARGLNREPTQNIGKAAFHARQADPAIAAQKALNERTQWLNQQRALFDRNHERITTQRHRALAHGGYIDPLQQLRWQEAEARRFYQVDAPPLTPDYQGRIQGAPGLDNER